MIDELEWVREDARLPSDAVRDAAVDDLIALIGGVDGIVQAQAASDARYFLSVVDRLAADETAARVEALLLKAYRWQFIVSGAVHPRFQSVLGRLVSEAQLARIQAALAPLAYAVPARAEAAAALAQ